MIIIKTPFRVSFAGGGSDIDSFYKRHYGAVISTTINKFMYVMLHPYFHEKIRIKYSRTEDVDSILKIRHPLVRESLKLMKIEKGIEIASIADVPAGSGLGSSSAFTVGLLNALSVYKNKINAKDWLAKMACQIEIDKVKEPIGKQDQYAVSYGGLNYIRFNCNGAVCVEPIILKPTVKQELANNLLLFYVGNERKASDILQEQKAAIREQEKYAAVCSMVGLVEKLRDALLRSDLDEFGEILHKGWVLKRNLTPNISNSRLDYIYEKALRSGAQGGKLLGAGGGGFFLFYCKPKYQDRLRRSLKLRELKFCPESDGTKVVYFDGG